MRVKLDSTEKTVHLKILFEKWTLKLHYIELLTATASIAIFDVLLVEFDICWQKNISK